jgi:hypothetical protein
MMMKKLLSFLLLTTSLSVTGQFCDPNIQSLQFDGSSYISFAPDPDFDITDDLTIEAWIYASSWASSYEMGTIVCKHGWTAGEKGYVLRAGGDGQLSFNIAGVDDDGDPAGWKEVLSNPNALQLNTWHHVAATYNGSRLRLYIDGIFVNDRRFTGTIDPSPDYALKIGRIADENAFSGRTWTGLIDEVRIWKRVLYQSDFTANKDQHLDTSLVGDLVGYWQFNEGSGSQVFDKGSANNSGYITGALRNANVPFTNGIPKPLIFEIGNSIVSSSLTGNQWNLNGIPIPGQTGASITPLQNGYYSVTSTYGLGCIATSDHILVLNVGISDTDQEGNFRYIVDNKIFRILKMPLPELHSAIHFFDMAGKEVFVKEHVRENDLIDLGRLNGGVYLYSLKNNLGILRGKISLP